MASNGIKGYGATISYGTAGSGNAGTTIGQVMDISGPGLEVDDIEITNMDSPDEAKEFIPGLLDAGEVTFDVVYTSSQLNSLQGIVGTPKYWEVGYPDGSVWDFDNSYVKSLGNEIPVNDKVAISITIKLSGRPNFSASSG